MPRFRVVVPFEPVIHETLDSRVFTNIPDTRLITLSTQRVR